MKHLTLELLSNRFSQLRELNTRNKQQPNQDNTRHDQKIMHAETMKNNIQIKREAETKQQEQKKKDNGVLSKNDIVRTVVRIKPYLEQYNNQIVKEQSMEDFIPQEADLLSEMLIRQNSRLCAKLNQLQLPAKLKVSERRKPGCVFEVSYYEEELKQLKVGEQQILAYPKKMQNCYAVVTEVLQIFLTLADVEPVCTVEMKSIEFVKYHNDVEYDYIKIKHTNGQTNTKCWVNIGFISKRQFHLFDRMLFLAKRISRTSPGRLFDNKLLYEILEKY